MSTASEQIDAELEIRQLAFRDIPAIMSIERDAFTTPWRAVTFEGLLSRTDTDVIGATRGGYLIGYTVAWTVGDQAELGNVAVEAPQRGKGIGRRLVAEALERVRRRGAREVFLEVRESNRRARSLYDEFGFRVIGRRKNYYTKPVEDALVMRLELD